MKDRIFKIAKGIVAGVLLVFGIAITSIAITKVFSIVWGWFY
jgi:hypothetical protein